MKFESIGNLRLPKIGFGTGRLGGLMWPNRWRDGHWLAAIRSALKIGYTHIDTAEMYSLGYAEELIRRAIRETGVERAGLFITSKVWPNHLRPANVRKACEGSLRRLGTDYLDLYLIHWPNPLVQLAETFHALNQLVREGKVRHIGVSNFNLTRLKEAHALCETPLLTNQIPYSVRTRVYAQNGVVDYCIRNDILVTAYTPVEHGRVHADGAIRSVGDAHGISPQQVALAWLVAQPRVVTIPMSFNPIHQKENLASVDIQLSESEMDQLNKVA